MVRVTMKPSIKEKSVVILCFLLAYQIGFYFSIASNDAQINAYGNEPIVHWNNSPIRTWWLDPNYINAPRGEWISAADRLIFAYEGKNNLIINSQFSSIFVNDRNNTIFIGIKNTNETIINTFLETMKPSEEVTVKFIKAKASLNELEKWKKLLKNKQTELINNEIKITSIITTVNGTLALGIENINSNKIQEIKNILSSEIPMGIIELYNRAPAEFEASQTDLHRPLLDGLQINFQNYTGYWFYGTFGFVVSWDNGTQHGFLTAAHNMMFSGNDAYQGGTTSSYKIGDTIDMNMGPYSDSALVEFDTEIQGNPHLWDSTVYKEITGRRDYNILYVGQTVYHLGAETGLTSGQITGKGDAYNGEYGDLYQQVYTDYNHEKGDSGGPVWLEFWLSGEKHYWGCGIHWGKDPDTDEGIFSPLDGIEDNLGYEVEITGPWVDDFGDNRRDVRVWEYLNNNSGVTVETQEKLQLNIHPRDPDVQSISGLVSKDAHDISEHSIEVDVDEFDSL